MNIDDIILCNQLQQQQQQTTQNLYGLFRATVVANGMEKTPVEEHVDKTKLGRIKVRIHALHDDVMKIKDLPWAEYCSPFGGSDDVGMFFVPEVGANVFIMFVNGNPTAPVWIGTWWSYEGENPETPRSAYINPHTEYPRNKVIRTRTGHQIEFDDSPLNKGIRITTSQGNLFHISDTDNTMTINCNGDFNLVVKNNLNISVGGNTHFKCDDDVRTEISNNVDIATKDINISGHINSKGDVNIVKGNLKLHEGSIAIDKPGHIIAKGKIETDNDIGTLGNIYTHGTIVADKSIYTKESFYDKFSKLYTNISKWFREHKHTGNFGAPTPMINDEQSYKELKKPNITD